MYFMHAKHVKTCQHTRMLTAFVFFVSVASDIAFIGSAALLYLYLFGHLTSLEVVAISFKSTVVPDQSTGQKIVNNTVLNINVSTWLVHALCMLIPADRCMP